MLTGVHHINFLVADLDAAIARYRELFEIETLIVEDLPERGVTTGRFELGSVWIVLVQPKDEKSEPARALREQGEGVFLVSFSVEHLDEAREKLIAYGAIDKSAEARSGLQNWRVIDIDPESVFGASLQLTEECQASLN